MSCTDVMYQPYASYFSSYAAQRSSAAAAAAGSAAYMDPFKKLGFQKMADPLDMGAYATPSATSHSSMPGLPLHSSLGSSGHGAGGGGGSTSHHPGSSPPATSMSQQSKDDTVESEEDKDSQPKDSQYLSANCVLLTYVNGDTASMVDDHFSRALTASQDSHVDKNAGSSWSSSSSKAGGIPMSQRNFPASFWNSHYQPTPTTPPSASFPNPLDPYSHSMASSLHGHMTAGAFSQDPWSRHYPFSSQAHSYGTHPGLHDLSSYSSMGSTSRFNPGQLGSLMPSKLGGLGSQYDIKPHTATSHDSWSAAAAGRYAGDPFSSSSLSATSHHQDPYSLAYQGALSGTC